MRRRWTIGLLMAALAAGAAPPCGATEADPDAAGAAAGNEAAVDVLARIERLRVEGGIAAAGQILDHVGEDASTEVRVAALRAVASIGLRSAAVGRAVREAAVDEDTAVRCAALEALGHVGDGRDVALLLGVLGDAEGRARTAAFAALGALSGRRLPASPKRCIQWWSVSERRTRLALEGAIEGLLETAGDERRSAPHRATIAREGWVDVEAVERAVRQWLASPDHALRAEALHAVGVLGLGEVAERVADTLPFLDARDVEEGRLAARRLGLSMEAVPQALRGDR